MLAGDSGQQPHFGNTHCVTHSAKYFECVISFTFIYTLKRCVLTWVLFTDEEKWHRKLIGQVTQLVLIRGTIWRQVLTAKSTQVIALRYWLSEFMNIICLIWRNTSYIWPLSRFLSPSVVWRNLRIYGSYVGISEAGWYIFGEYIFCSLFSSNFSINSLPITPSMMYQQSIPASCLIPWGLPFLVIVYWIRNKFLTEIRLVSIVLGGRFESGTKL